MISNIELSLFVHQSQHGVSNFCKKKSSSSQIPRLSKLERLSSLPTPYNLVQYFWLWLEPTLVNFLTLAHYHVLKYMIRLCVFSLDKRSSLFYLKFIDKNEKRFFFNWEKCPVL